MKGTPRVAVGAQRSMVNNAYGASEVIVQSSALIELVGCHLHRADVTCRTFEP